MFALNETAFLYPSLGHRSGRAAFAETGAIVRCRSEPAWAHRASGSAVERVADIRIFANVSSESPIHARLNPRPGDRIELNGRCYRIAEVQPMRGWRGIHHLELLAKDEGPAGRIGGDA